jgi:hypothetical protein
MRIIGDDGKPEIVTLNQPGTDENGVSKILNDVTVGQYDVVMDTGPGYNSKRAEAVDSMMSLLGADPSLMQQAGDLIFRNMDFPGADIIADRLAAVNPLSQIDEKSEIPPQAQMMIAQGKQQIQQLQQQIQMMQMDAKYRASVTEQKDQAMLKKTAMELQVKQADSQLRTDTIAHDTVIKTQTQLEIEQLKAQLALVLAHMNKTEMKLSNEEAVERAI